MARLTKRAIEKATAKAGKQVLLWDGELRGFGLRITSAGARSFIVQFRTARGRSRRLTLGPYGVLTADEARKMARRILAEAQDGRDPAVVRFETRHEPTVKDLAERYLEQHAEPKKKPSSVASDRRMLRKHILPAIGRLAISEVTTREIAQLHHAMRKTPIQANRVLSLLSKAFSLAERWGLRSPGVNPARGLDRYPENQRERFLTETELSRLGEVLKTIEGDDREMPTAVAAIRFILFTGCRRGEALNLRWDEIDFQRGMVFLSDSKTGRKPLVLNAPALAIISEQERTSEWVFTGRYAHGPLVGLTRIWYRVREEADLDGVRLHDLRHSFASVGAGAGLGLPLIGKLLGHTQAATTQRYAHLADDPVRVASEMIGSRIAAALDNKPNAEVLPIRSSGGR